MNKKQIRYAFQVVQNAAGNVNCEDLHHKPNHYHEDGEACKVEYHIARQLAILRKHLEESGVYT